MSVSLHVCKICGKKFSTAKAMYGHQRIHKGNRVEDDVLLQQLWDVKESKESETLYPLQKLHKASNFMSETEEHEMYEAAMTLVTLSEQVDVTRDLTQGDIAMDLELKSLPDQSFLHCVESKQEFIEVFPHLGFEKSSTCSDVVVVAQALPLKKSSYKCKICGKTFDCFRSLGGHQTLHRSDREKLALKRALRDKKIDSKPSRPSFEVSQEELRNANVKKEHCVESKQDFSEVFSHSGFEKFGTCNDVSAQTTLPSPMRSESQSKRFDCSKAPGSHHKLRILLRGQFIGKKEGS